MKLPAPRGRLRFFLHCLRGSLKEQVLADSRELNRLRKRVREDPTFRQVVDQIKTLLVKREVLLELRPSAGGRLQVRRMYEIPADSLKAPSG